MRLLFLFLTLILMFYAGGCFLHAQSTFYKSYDLNSTPPWYQSDQGKNILIEENGYLILSGTRCIDPNMGSYNCFGLIRIDSTGEVLWKRAYKERPNTLSSSIAPFTMIKTSDGHYLIAGYQYLVDEDDFQFALMKVKENGDSLWVRTYNNLYMDGIREVIELHSGNYLLSGEGNEKDADGNFINSDLTVMEVDTSGQKVWSKKLGLTDQFFVNEKAEIEVLSDSVYAFLYRTIPYTILHDDSIRLITTNAAGEVLWERSLNEYIKVSSYSIEQHPEGGFYYAHIETSNFPPYYTLPFVSHIDQEGEVLWKHFFEPPRRDPVRMHRMDDGDVLICGGTMNNPASAWLSRVSPEGEVLWNRLYRVEGHPSIEYRFIDVKDTPDGGIIASGRWVDTLPGGQIDPNVFLLKLDGDGCFHPGCGGDTVSIVTSTQEVLWQPAAGEGWLELSPNPATDVLRLVSLQPLPEGSRLEVFSLQGRQLWQEVLPAGYLQGREVSVSGWAPGPYALLLKSREGNVLETKMFSLIGRN